MPSLNLPPLILASRSPRRSELLARLELPFDIMVPRIREIDIPGNARSSALKNAIRKNIWCVRHRPDATVIAADTVIEFRGRLIGKPSSLPEARKFFRDFSGNSHSVLTAVAFSFNGCEPETTVTESFVTFRRLEEAAIDNYLEACDPMDKAGGYDINCNGRMIIEEFSGSCSNIMGLPVKIVADWLRRRGYSPKCGIQDRGSFAKAAH